jgi:hypothetical protein
VYTAPCRAGKVKAPERNGMRETHCQREALRTTLRPAMYDVTASRTGGMRSFVGAGLLAAWLVLPGCAEEPKAAPAAVASVTTSSAAVPPPVAPRETALPPVTSAAPRVFACGAKGQEPCPMQKWMKAEIGVASAEADLPKIAEGLAVIAAKDPGFPEWKAISEEGLAKAKAGDLDGARMSCRKCHDKYKRIYVTTMRDRPY